MAFIKEFGKAENDPGEWVEIGNDGDRVVKLKIRALNEDIRDGVIRRHTKQEKVDLPQGGRMVQPVPSDMSAYTAMQVEHASWCLLASENLWVEPQDEESAKAYGKAIGREGQVKVGEEFCVDEHLGPATKELLLRKNQAFREAVIDAAGQIAKRKTAHMKSLEGNS